MTDQQSLVERKLSLPVTKEQQSFIAMRAEGRTVRECAVALALPPGQLRKWMRRPNVRLRIDELMGDIDGRIWRKEDSHDELVSVLDDADSTSKDRIAATKELNNLHNLIPARRSRFQDIDNVTDVYDAEYNEIPGYPIHKLREMASASTEETSADRPEKS